MPLERISNTGAVTDQPVDLERIRAAVVEILEAIGEDSQRDGLKRTPERVAKMYAEVFAGLSEDPEHHLEVQFEAGHDEMVLVKDIPFYSMCEHHMLPFFGKIQIAYTPNGRVFGISKLVRLVEKYSKRLQIQERLTKNIADELYSQGIKGVAVMTDAEHLCMKMRGVKNDAKLTCSAFRGIYEDQKIKQEIIKTIQTRPTAQI